MSETQAVTVSGLRKVYVIGNEKVVALNKIDLEIPKGEICCILGTSGSGKSTLLNMLAGLEKPTRGKVVIFGEDVTAMNERKLAAFRQKYVGFVFQSYDLIGSMNALENVALPLSFRGMQKKKREKLARNMLMAMGLEKRIYHKPGEMSGGQQQRVGIARAFISRPEIVFADEPTGNLDSHTTSEVMELMVKQCRKYGSTMVMVTHDRDIAAYADRILTIIDGSIVKDEKNVSILGSGEIHDEEKHTGDEEKNEN